LRDDTYLLKHYKNVKLIKKGGFGAVFKADLNGKTIAVKVIESDDQNDFTKRTREIENLARLKNYDNILGYENYHMNIENKPYQLFIEMDCADTSLANLIKESQSRINYSSLIPFLRNIANGLEAAHKVKIAHLDLKPDNILIVNSIAKIADWGGSVILHHDKVTILSSKELSFTLGFVAPELLKDLLPETELNLYKCDIYSFGIMVLKCCGLKTGIPKDEARYHDLIVNAKIKSIYQYYPPNFCDYLKKMCNYYPKERPTIEEVKIFLNNLK